MALLDWRGLQASRAARPAGSHFQCDGNDFLVPIPFLLSSNHSHSHLFPFQHCLPMSIFPSLLFPFPPIPIPISGSDYNRLPLKPRNMCIVSWIQNKIWSYSRSIVNQTHHSSVIITAYQCSLFNVYQTVTACYDEYGWEFYFSPIKYAIPIPIRTIPILISSPKLLPFPFPCTPLVYRLS